MLTVGMTVVCSVDCWVALMDALLVDWKDALMVVCSVDRSAVSLAAWKDAPWVD